MKRGKNHSAEECEADGGGLKNIKQKKSQRKIRIKNTKKTKFICSDDLG
jgi:hypothetical protein